MAYAPQRRRFMPMVSAAPQFSPGQGGGNANSPLNQRGAASTSEGGPNPSGGGLGLGQMMGPAMMGKGVMGGSGNAASGLPYHQYAASELAPQSAAYEGSTMSGAGMVAPDGQALASPTAANPIYSAVSPNAGGANVMSGQLYGNSMYSPAMAAQMNAAAPGGAGLLGPEAAITGAEMYGPAAELAGAAEVGGATAAADMGAAAAGAEVAAASAAPAMAAEGAALAAAPEAGLLAAMGPWGWAAGAGLLGAGLIGSQNGWFDDWF